MTTTEDECLDTFNLFDHKGDGKIYVSNLGDVLRSCNENPTEGDVKKVASEFSSPDQRITFDQFMPVLNAIRKKRDTCPPEDFIEGFKVFDREQNGLISSAELRHLLTALGERLTDEEVEQLLQGCEDSNGNVNYNDFVRHVMNQ